MPTTVTIGKKMKKDVYKRQVIMRENIDPLTPIEELPERSSVDEVVQFIDEKITEAETIGLAENCLLYTSRCV